MMEIQEGTGIKLISKLISHVILYDCSTMDGIQNGIYKQRIYKDAHFMYLAYFFAINPVNQALVTF